MFVCTYIHNMFSIFKLCISSNCVYCDIVDDLIYVHAIDLRRTCRNLGWWQGWSCRCSPPGPAMFSCGVPTWQATMLLFGSQHFWFSKEDVQDLWEMHTQTHTGNTHLAVLSLRNLVSCASSTAETCHHWNGSTQKFGSSARCNLALGSHTAFTMPWSISFSSASSWEVFLKLHQRPRVCVSKNKHS